MILYSVIGLVGGYAIGSIPFGLVFTKFTNVPDIRTIGSGNIGATNVLRTGRKDLALLTLVCDSGKGAFAVVVLGLLNPFAAVGAMLGAVLGHLYPIWLKFKGGKGVATTFGALLALMPVVGVLTCCTWLVVALLYRISSLSALIAVAVAPFFAGLVYGDLYACVTILIAGLIWFKHRENIQRLIQGLEPKIGSKK